MLPTVMLLKVWSGLFAVLRFTVCKMRMACSAQNVRNFNQLSKWHFVSGLNLHAPISKRLTLRFGTFCSKNKN